MVVKLQEHPAEFSTQIRFLTVELLCEMYFKWRLEIDNENNGDFLCT